MKRNLKLGSEEVIAYPLYCEIFAGGKYTLTGDISDMTDIIGYPLVCLGDVEESTLIEIFGSTLEQIVQQLEEFGMDGSKLSVTSPYKMSYEPQPKFKNRDEAIEDFEARPDSIVLFYVK